MNKQRVRLPSAELDIFSNGDGSSVLLLQHFRRNSFQHFAGLATAIVEAGFRVVVVDQRGLGTSTGSLESVTLHDLAGDIAGIIEALDCAPAHVLGHAFDNRIARCLAADRPDLVKSLVLLAAGWIAGPTPDGQAAILEMARADATDAERLAAVRTGIYTSARRATATVRDWEGIPAFAAPLTAANAATPLDEWWHGGSAPMLVIQGLDDIVAPPENGRALKERLGDRVRLVEIPNAAHILLPEEPEVIAEAIISFLHEQEESESNLEA